MLKPNLFGKVVDKDRQKGNFEERPILTELEQLPHWGKEVDSEFVRSDFYIMLKDDGLLYRVNCLGREICAHPHKGGFCQIGPVGGIALNRCSYHMKGKTAVPVKKKSKNRFIKNVPKNLRKVYEEAIEDPELLSIKNEIGILQSLIDQTVASLNGTLLQATFVDLQQTWQAFREANQARNMESVIELGATLEQLINDGASEAQRWDRFIELVEVKADLAGKETKRMTDLNAVLAVDDVLILMQRIVLLVKQELVDDKPKLNRILGQILLLMGPARSMFPDAKVESKPVVIETTTNGQPISQIPHPKNGESDYA